MKYLPFHYATQCKRNKKAGLPFFYDNLGDDLLIVLIAFALASGAPVFVALAIVILHFSFWIIYEVGYFENDSVSNSLERDGKTPAEFEYFKQRFSEPLAWAWALVLGLIGVGVVTYSPMSYFASPGLWGLLANFALWFSVLAALRALYYLYNHVDKMTRVYLYLPLQLLKYAFPIIFFTLPPAGAALIFAQITRRWIPYVIYRYAGKIPDHLPARLIRLIVFILLWMLLLPANFNNEHLLIGVVGAAILLIRSRSQFRGILRMSKSVRLDDWRSVK